MFHVCAMCCMYGECEGTVNGAAGACGVRGSSADTRLSPRRDARVWVLHSGPHSHGGEQDRQLGYAGRLVKCESFDRDTFLIVIRRRFDHYSSGHKA